MLEYWNVDIKRHFLMDHNIFLIAILHLFRWVADIISVVDSAESLACT